VRHASDNRPGVDGSGPMHRDPGGDIGVSWRRTRNGIDSARTREGGGYARCRVRITGISLSEPPFGKGEEHPP